MKNSAIIYIAFLGLFSFVFIENSAAQCDNYSNYPVPNNVVHASSFGMDSVIIYTAVHAGEYSKIDELSVYETYEFKSSIAGDELTIRGEFGELIQFGVTPLTISPNTDKIQFHLNSPSCGGNDGQARKAQFVCTTCDEMPSRIGVRTSYPKAVLDVHGEIRLGKTTTPPVAGMIRWNSTIDDFEGYNGTAWLSLTKAKSSWGELQTSDLNENHKLIAGIGSEDDSFGFSVAISDKYAVVGAYKANIDGNNNQGAIYIFKKLGTSWGNKKKISASDGAANDYFGYSVDIFEDDIIVGAWGDNIGSNNNQGSAYIFRRSGVTWTQSAKLIAGDGAAFDEFGYSVSIDDRVALVGARKADPFGYTNSGAAYCYYRSNGSALWNQVDKLAISQTNAEFGTSVSCNKNYSIVGAPKYDTGIASNLCTDCGRARIYNNFSNGWNHLETIDAYDEGTPDGSDYDNFGISVSICNGKAVVGSYKADVNGVLNQGAVYVFGNSDNNWGPYATKVVASDGQENDYFGKSVSVSEDGLTWVAGAYKDDVNAYNNQGSVYIFNFANSDYRLRSKVMASDGIGNDDFGNCVYITNTNAIIGTKRDFTYNTTHQGAYILVK